MTVHCTANFGVIFPKRFLIPTIEQPIIGVAQAASDYIKNNSFVHSIEFINSRNRGYAISMESNLKKDRLLENFKKLERYSLFGDNWNGEGASSFSQETLDFVKHILVGLNQQPQIFPVSDGSIQLEYENTTGEYVEFVVSNVGIVDIFTIDSDGIESEYNIAEDSLVELLNKLNSVVKSIL